MTIAMRQGDILLIRVPDEAREEIIRLGRLRADGVIVRGEVTGHAHRVDPTKARVLEVPRSDASVELYVEVLEATQVVHETHMPLPLSPGLYAVRRQRELSLAQAVRLVTD